MGDLERCINCNQPTGRAGRAEDSLYLETIDLGPLCETCWDGIAEDQERLDNTVCERLFKDNQRLAAENRLLKKHLGFIESCHCPSCSGVRAALAPGEPELDVGYCCPDCGQRHIEIACPDSKPTPAEPSAEEMLEWCIHDPSALVRIYRRQHLDREAIRAAMAEVGS